MDPEIREYIFDFGFGSVTLLDQRQTFDCFSIRTKWAKFGFRKQYLRGKDIKSFICAIYELSNNYECATK